MIFSENRQYIDFKIENKHDNTYSLSLINLYYEKLNDQSKLLIHFTRARVIHDFKDDMLEDLKCSFEKYNNKTLKLM